MSKKSHFLPLTHLISHSVHFESIHNKDSSSGCPHRIPRMFAIPHQPCWSHLSISWFVQRLFWLRSSLAAQVALRFDKLQFLGLFSLAPIFHVWNISFGASKGSTSHRWNPWWLTSEHVFDHPCRVSWRQRAFDLRKKSGKVWAKLLDLHGVESWKGCVWNTCNIL